jgi:hypothetical protein
MWYPVSRTKSPALDPVSTNQPSAPPARPPPGWFENGPKHSLSDPFNFSVYSMAPPRTLGEEAEGLQVLDDVAGLVGDEQQEQRLDRLVHVSDKTTNTHDFRGGDRQPSPQAMHRDRRGATRTQLGGTAHLDVMTTQG